MMKRKTIVPLLALVTVLGSCSGADSASSSSLPSSVLPVQLYDNYRREGGFQIAMDISGLGISGQNKIYQSPVILDYQADEKQGYGPNASFQILPFEVTGTDEERLKQANSNQSVLHALFSLTSQLLLRLNQETGMLPVLADRYSEDFESVIDLPKETFAFQSIDSLTSVIDTTEEGDKEKLRFLAAQKEDEDGGLDIDFSNVTIDVPALLHYLTDLLPGEAVLRPIFSTVGDVVQFLTNSLSLKILPVTEEETEITLFINDTGREQLIESLSKALGSTILDNARLDELSLTVKLFDDETLMNQLEECQITLALSALTFDFDLSIEANLDKEHEKLSDDYFDSFDEKLASRKAIYEEVQPFYTSIKDVIPWKDSLISGNDLDYGKIDLSQNAVTQMESQAENYFALSSDGKDLLGDRFLVASTKESLSNILLEAHRDGVEKIEKLKNDYQNLGKTIDDDNYVILFQDVSQYLNWEQALMDYDAGVEKEAFDQYREDRFARAQEELEKAKQDFQNFVLSPSEETLEKALEDYQQVDNLLSISDQYLSSSFQSRKEELQKNFQTESASLPKAYHEYFSSLLPSLDYETLAELSSSEAVTNGAFYSVDLLSEEERGQIRNLLEQECLRLKKGLLESATSLASLEQQFLSDQTALLTLEQTEKNLLATDVYGLEYRSLKVELGKILQA